MRNENTILDFNLLDKQPEYMSEEIFQKHIFPKNIWSSKDLESHINGLRYMQEIEFERLGRIDKSDINENTLLDLQKNKEEIDILEDLLYHFKREENYLYKERGNKSVSSKKIELFPNLYQIHYKILQYQKQSFKNFQEKVNQQEIKIKYESSI